MSKAEDETKKDFDNDNTPNLPSNGGTMIVDATSQIKFPQDTKLLNEALKLTEMIERYKGRKESYPEWILADKIYRNRDIMAYCTKRKIHFYGPTLGIPNKGEIQ